MGEMVEKASMENISAAGGIDNLLGSDCLLRKRVSAFGKEKKTSLLASCQPDDAGTGGGKSSEDSIGLSLSRCCLAEMLGDYENVCRFKEWPGV